MASIGNRALDISGQRFGKLVALERGPLKRGSYTWRCKCDCGTEKFVLIASLRGGQARSCGCAAREAAYRHGQKDTVLHKRWRQFRSRCNNARDRRWKDYGGRGITYALEWDDFTVFAAWATNSGFRPELQIDRIDNDGPYSPENCRWVTAEVNMNNTRRSRKYEFFGELLSVSQAARKFGVNESTLHARLVDRGEAPNDAVKPRPHHHTRWLTIGGKRLTLSEAARLYNIPYGTLKSRLVRGKSDEEAVL